MYTQNARGWAKHLDFTIIDCLCLACSYYLSYWIRQGVLPSVHDSLFMQILVVLILLDNVVLLILNTFEGVIRRGLLKELTATFTQTCILFLGCTAYLYMSKIGTDFSRIVTILTMFIYLVTSYITRNLWKSHLHRRGNRQLGNSLLVMAEPDVAENVITEIRKNNYDSYQFVGIITPNPRKENSKIADVDVVADAATAIDYVKSHWVDEILLAIQLENNIPTELVDTLLSMGVTVHIYVDSSNIQTEAKQLYSNIGGLRVISNTINYMTPRQAITKRILDIAGGLVGCLICGILYLILAPLIKKESPGPVFFSQIRIGKNGKKFKMYKFRSMYMDAEERKAELLSQNKLKNNMMFKMDFDPRVIGNRIDPDGTRHTGIGEFIRKYSLDEFPQFYNVLIGDMSLVGTRPPLVNEYEQYSAYHKARLAIRPGITGLWQISGRSNIEDFEEVVKLDTQYINNFSNMLDLKILVKTVLAVLKKDGSM